LVVDPAFCFTLMEEDYNPNWYCEKSGVFRRHQFGYVGELKSDGEEFDCAVHIDQMPGVERWVRNLVRSDSSFSLPTATDRFYPDFIALLKDGRVLIVEYKGEHLWKDAADDRAIGELWAARSGGRCVFVMLTERKWGMIDEVIARRG
jgi:type III restriction enzyme